jgi:hypothetical protein
VVFVRVNPDKYNKGQNNAKKMDRKVLLGKVLKLIVGNYEKIDTPLQVLYLYYSPTNPVISKRIPKTMIYKESDFKLN